MGFVAPAILLGLGALAIPPLVHLLNRRRFDVVDWGAMRFLIATQKTKKKIFLEQLLLLLLRLAVILFLVLGISSPWVKPTGWMKRFAPAVVVGEGRDVVLVLDGSFSMGQIVDGKSAHEAALKWGSEYLAQFSAGDSVAIVLARQQPLALVGNLSSDLQLLQSTLRDAPKPRGGGNLPAAVREAIRILKGSTKTRKEIVILSDGQRQGWADPKSLEGWELLRGGIAESELPPIGVVNVVPDWTGEEGNWSLTPIRASRSVASVGREVQFHTQFQLSGPADTKPPTKVRFEVDGRPAGDLVPARTGEKLGIPIMFPQRFSTPGSHLVSILIDDDALPGDNRRDYVVEVLPKLPILIIDGDPKPAPMRGQYRGSDFLRDALAPSLDTSPAFLIKTYSVADFAPDLLTRPLGPDAGSVPRVLVLSNVGRLKPDAAKAIEEFLSSGGGVLLALGSRSDPTYWNDEPYREGKGWLPARLIEPVGVENNLDKAARVLASSLEGPPFDAFKSDEPGTLVGAAYFPRYWKLELLPEAGGIPVVMLNSRNPLMVEKAFGKGRVLEAAIPLDNTWRSNLTDLGDFVRLAHESVYALAAGRGTESNLASRQPIVYRPLDGELPGPITVQPPDAPSQRIPVKAWPMIFEETTDTGIYKLTTDTGKVRYYVVQPDGEESKLAKLNDEDRRAVARLLPGLRFATQIDDLRTEESENAARWEIWWLLLLGVIAMLILENRMTSKAAG